MKWLSRSIPGLVQGQRLTFSGREGEPLAMQSEAALGISDEETGRGLFFRSAHLEAFFADRGGDRLIISFNEMGLRANGRDYWASGLLAKLSISAVGIISTEPNWFPGVDVRSCAERLRELIGDRFQERIAYGMSQGGYAALKYPSLFNCSLGVSFSPQYSIDPTDIKDGRFNQFFRADVHRDMAIDPSDAYGHAYVFFDPYDEGDALHASLIRQALPAKFVPIRGAGHASVRAFTSSTAMSRLFDACFAKDDVTIDKLCAAARYRAPMRALGLAFFLARARPRWALSIWKKYRAAESANPWSQVCYRLSESGQSEQVLPWLVDMAAEHPNDAQIQASCALVSMKAGKYPEAIRYSGAAVTLVPDNETYKHINRLASSKAGSLGLV